jgi:hypothetical protein
MEDAKSPHASYGFRVPVSALRWWQSSRSGRGLEAEDPARVREGGDHRSGYIIITPDFPECIDDCGFLWFEDEAVVAGSASWVATGNAAEAIVREAQ